MSDTSTIVALSASVGAAINDLSDHVQEMSAQLGHIEQLVGSMGQETNQVLLRTKLFVQTKESEAEMLLQRLANTVERVPGEVISEVTTGLNDGLSRVASENEKLIAATHTMQEFMQVNLNSLDLFKTELQHSESEFAGAMKSIAAFRETHSTRADAFEGETNTVVEDVRSVGQQVANTLQSEIERLRSESTEFTNAEIIEHASGQLESLSTEMKQLLSSEFVQVLETGGVNIESFIQDTVMSQFKDLLGALSGLVDEVIQALHDATSNSSAEREALDALIKQIEEITGPLEGSLDTVRDIASAVGFDI